MWVSVCGICKPSLLELISVIELYLMWLIRYSVSCWVYLGQAQPSKQLSDWKHQSETLSVRRSVFWAAVILSWQGAEALSSISPLSKHGHLLHPHTPPRPAVPLQFTITETEGAKLEEKRIKMGNLPVIPRTASKRAICLINSLFCLLPSGPHPSSRPSVHHAAAERERREVKGSLGEL